MYSGSEKMCDISVSATLCIGGALLGQVDTLQWRHSTMASQITNLTIVYSTVYSGADQRKHQSSASLAFVGGIHRWPVNSPHKGLVTRKMILFDDVITAMLFGGPWGSVDRGNESHGISSYWPVTMNVTHYELLVWNMSAREWHQHDQMDGLSYKYINHVDAMHDPM